jgi:hypothetical protein
MSQFSPHPPRVGVLSTVADDAGLALLMHGWSDEKVQWGQVMEAASPDTRYPELLLLVMDSVTPADTEEGKAAVQVAQSAREQGALVVGVVAAPHQTEGSPFHQRDVLHGLIEVAPPATLETALNALLRLVLMPGVIRLETEDIENFFRASLCCRLTVGQGEGSARIEGAMAAATQVPHATTLVALKGHWLVGIMSDTSLSSDEFNAAGEWLQARVSSAHEITVIASCDEALIKTCQVVVLAGC